jgi:hypothetical protein
MKGFAGILILFTVLILSVILLNSTYYLKNEDSTTSIIPKIKNLTAIYETNLMNMASDCNWDLGTQTTQDCLTVGANIIFEKTKLDPLISCIRPTIQFIDSNNYNFDLNCTNKIILQRNTNFSVQKTVIVTRPLQ